MNNMSSIHNDEFVFFPSDLENETRKTPKKASNIPLVFSKESVSRYNIIMNNIEIAILIFTAIDVNATPFFCELIPIKRNSEMKIIAEMTTKNGQFPWLNAAGFHSLPNNRIPQMKAVK